MHTARWVAVAVLAAGIGLLLLGGVAGSDSSITVTEGDFELTCPAGTVAESATLACTLKNTSAEAKPWPVVAILHLSTDTDRALVRGTSVDVALGAPSPSAAIDGGVTWIGDTLVGYSRFDWPGNAGADPTKTTTTVAAPGNSRTVNIVASHDSFDEDSEKFYVALGPDGSRGVGLLYNNRTSVTVTDDDGPSTDTSLSSLKLFAGRSYTLSPTQAVQSQTVAYEVTEATLTAAASAPGATMTLSASLDGNSVNLDGRGGTSIEVISGQESAAVPLAVGTTQVAVTVTAEDGTTTGTHTVSIVRSALGDGVDTVAVSVPSFTLTCPAEVAKASEARCTLRASGSAEWPVVAVIHSSADGASRALVAEDPIIPDTDPGYSKDVSLSEQQPARTAFNRGYGELFSGGSRTLYRTYGYEKFDWSGTASAGDTRTVTISLHDNEASGGRTDEVFYVALAPSGYTGLSQLVDNKVPILIAGLPGVTDVQVVSNAGGDDTYAIGEVLRIRVTFSEAVDVTGTPKLGIDMDPAQWGRKDAVYSSGSGTTELTFTHEVVEPNFSSQGIALLANTLALNGGTIRTAAGGTNAGLAHPGLGHDPAHKVDWQREQNKPPEFNGASDTHDNALPGQLVTLAVSKEDFADPDGDALTFELSASRGDVHVTNGYGYFEEYGRIWFQAKTACALAALGAPAGGKHDTVITLTATDPEGATAQATATFRTNPNAFACPTLSSAAVDGATLTITLAADGVLPPGFRPPTADEFVVKADGAAVGLAETGAVTASGRGIVLRLASPVTSDQTVTVSYTPGDDSMAAAFADRAVTNNTPEPEPEPFSLFCFPAHYDAANQRWTLVEPLVGPTGEPTMSGSLIAAHCSFTHQEGVAAAITLSGADADMFELTAEGTLSFAVAPDFEAPADSDNDNVYEVALTPTVGSITSTPLSLTVTVTDGPETEVIVIAVPEEPEEPEEPADCTPDPSGTMTPICAAVSGNELILTFNRDLVAVNDATARTLRQVFLVNGAYDQNGAAVNNQSPSSVAVDANTVTLALGTAIAPGNDAAITYYGGLNTTDGTAVEAFTTTLTTTQAE